MLDTKLRHYIQPLCNTIGSIFISYNISATTITALSFLCGIAASISIVYGYSYLSVAFLWLSGFFDVLDGTVARLTTPTKVGAYVDLISDRMVESAYILGLITCYPHQGFYCVLFMIALLFHFSTFLVAGALFKNNGKKSMHYDTSIVERGEAFIIFSLITLFPDHLSILLTSLSLVILSSGLRRFIRVIQFHSSQVETTPKA